MSHLETKEVARQAAPRSRLIAMVILLNLILMGAMLYETFGRSLIGPGGITIALINGTPSAMVDMVLEYPGGKLSVPRLDPTKQVGNPLQVKGEFEAIITFKDEEGHAYREPIKIKPMGDLLLLLYVLPVLEKAEVTTKDGQVIPVLKSSPSRVRVLPSYKGEDTNV